MAIGTGWAEGSFADTSFASGAWSQVANSTVITREERIRIGANNQRVSTALEPRDLMSEEREN